MTPPKTRRDEYRVTLFKKKLREIIGAPWARFSNSKGRCHLCLNSYSHGQDNMEMTAALLMRAGIEFKVRRDIFGLQEMFGVIPKIDQICIPIDQAALPERKR